jgi:hypothetical protein
MRGFDVTVAANEVIFAASGKFVRRTGATTSTVTFAGDGSDNSDLLGHLECEVLNSAEGTEVRWCVFDSTAVFRLPLHPKSGQYYEYMKGKRCDLLLSNGVQYVCLNSATEGAVYVVDGDSENTVWADVALYQGRTQGVIA